MWYSLIYFFQPVSSILTKDGVAEGVVLEDGTEIKAKAVLSNATPKITFLDLLPQVMNFNVQFLLIFIFLSASIGIVRPD